MAVPQKNMDKLAAHKKFKFNIMFVGSDWKGTEKWKKIESQMKNINVKVVYFPIPLELVVL